MATVAFDTMVPTGDAVFYDPANVDYPAANVVSTFSTLWASKLQAYDMNILEVASAGKIAFTPSNVHSLDLSGDESNVTLRARAGRALVAQNEDGSAALEIADAGTLQLSAGSNSLLMDANANALDAGPGSNVFLGQAHVFDVAGTEVLAVTAAGATVSNLVVAGTDLRVPVGATGDRPGGAAGQVFYNTTAGRFEGFAAGAWSGLGGVVDVDQDTFVAAESSAGADDDALRFVTAGDERMRISPGGLLGYGTSNPEYTFDIVGDLRVSGNIIANSTTIGEGNGKVMKLAVQNDGSAEIIDGLETNDGAGLSVAGAPSANALASANVARFEKSLKWHYGSSGMEGLGKAAGWDQESYWKLRGGSFRMGVTNPDSGAETEVIFRVNEQDELQLVRHVTPVDGSAESYDVIAKFGQKRGAEAVSAARGFVTLDADQTSMDTANATVAAFVESFASYDSYRVHGALFPVANTPTAAQVLAAAAANGYVSGVLGAATDNVTQTVFTAMHDGAAIPDAIIKFVGVTEMVSDGATSAAPFTSFVLNSSSIYSEIEADMVADSESQTAVTLEYTFESITWDELSATDKVVFQEWFEAQLLQGAAERGIGVNSVELTIVSGSIRVTSTMFIETASVTKTLTNTMNPAAPLAMLKSPGTAIEFVDRAAVTIDPATVATSVSSVERIQTNPQIVTVAETATTGSTITVAYEVKEANAEFAITKLYAITTSTALATNAVPSSIKNAPGVQAFTISGTSGSVQVAAAITARTFVYIVAENNATTPVLSTIKRVIVDPMSIQTSSLTVAPSGYYNIASQTPGEYAAETPATISVYTTAASATAHLMVFPEGSAPADAQAAKVQLDAGAVDAQAALA